MLCDVFIFNVFSVEYLETQVATAIQLAYDMDTPPQLTIEHIGKPTADYETWQDATQVRWLSVSATFGGVPFHHCLSGCSLAI